MAPDKLHLVLSNISNSTFDFNREFNNKTNQTVGVNSSDQDKVYYNPIPKGFRGYQDTKNNQHWKKKRNEK